MSRASDLKAQVVGVLRDFVTLDLRLSHLIIVGLVALGGMVNLLLPHGWTAWPIVFVAAVMTVVHEAAERNGQGVPPLHVYALFVGVVVVWLGVGVILSTLNPIIVLLGIIVLGYYCGRGYMQKRQHDQLIAFRRAEGLCVFCGEPANPKNAYCENCGEEPDPDMARTDRVRALIGKPQGHARAVLTGAQLGMSPSQKEQALMARRRSRQGKGR